MIRRAYIFRLTVLPTRLPYFLLCLLCLWVAVRIGLALGEGMPYRETCGDARVDAIAEELCEELPAVKLYTVAMPTWDGATPGWVIEDVETGMQFLVTGTELLYLGIDPRRITDQEDSE